ncbi:hypothetical protein EZS27_024850 [termite gut metagenome]|uniref:Uncharacterized protein n=1 Tax=termite gut metagenome TaxID=433724 RepID=A0A5J4QZU6_9ZZZZ
MNKNIILLTGSIDIARNNVPYTVITNLSERINQYLANIRKIILHTNFDYIVFCENTNYAYDYSFLIRLAESRGKKMEILSFQTNETKVREKGKGFGEGEIIKYALTHSSYLQDDTLSFYKLTGRVFIKNINVILCLDNNKKNIFLKTKKCSRSAIDSVFFKVNIGEYKNYLLESYKSVNDINNNYFEHVYYEALIHSPMKVNRFSILPYQDGISASNGMRYNLPFIDSTKKGIKLYLGFYKIKTNQPRLKTYLIFEPYDSGHRKEYMTNILSYIIDNDEYSDKYIFAFNSILLDILECEKYKSDKIRFTLISKPVTTNTWKRAMHEYNIIAKLYKQFRFDHVILPNFDTFTLASIIKKYKFKVSGILYKPFNPKKKYSFLLRIIKHIQYFCISRKKQIQSVFILNNPKLSSILNETYVTDKFTNLVDPVPIYTPSNINPYSQENKIIGLHFGSLDERKGTFSILHSLPLIVPEIREQLLLAFVGMPSVQSKEKIEHEIQNAKRMFPEITIDYRPEFVSDDLMENYYQFAQFVLIPYKHITMSSGVLGHAARWGNYIIGNKGVVGDLINEYQLGEAITPTNEEIARAITAFATKKCTINRENVQKYLSDHSVSQFVKTLFT